MRMTTTALGMCLAGMDGRPLSAFTHEVWLRNLAQAVHWRVVGLPFESAIRLLGMPDLSREGLTALWIDPAAPC
jgi:hypothetical protein